MGKEEILKNLMQKINYYERKLEEFKSEYNNVFNAKEIGANALIELINKVIVVECKEYTNELGGDGMSMPSHEVLRKVVCTIDLSEYFLTYDQVNLVKSYVRSTQKFDSMDLKCIKID